MTESAKPSSAPARGLPLDEKLYYLFVTLGLLIIAGFFTVTIVRSQRAEAARKFIPPRQLGDFTLTNHTGRVVQRVDLANRMLVVNFVFTSCGISCLQVSRHMSEIQRRTAGREDVLLISLSVDPRTDTPVSLARFANRYEADPRRWLFLTGDKGVLYPLIETSFLGPTAALPHDDAPAGMIHSDQIAVMDASGRLRALFDGLKPTVADDVLKALDQWRSPAG